MMGMGSSSPNHHHHQPTPSSCSYLEKYLQSHLVLHGEKGDLQCHVFPDHYTEADWATASLPSPNLSATEYLRTRYLILVSQVQPLPVTGPIFAEQRRKNEMTVVVMGLSVVEYALRGKETASRCYIQYVDTTGMVRPRSLQGHLTKTLLKAYLCYSRDVLQVSSLHLFASPKPSLLFAGSEVGGKKGILGGRQLISWWLALLTECIQVSLSPSVFASIFAYSPSEELLPQSAQHTRHCIDMLQSKYQSSLMNIHYGVPYRGDEPALARIPAFEDDPKWRHLEALIESPDESHKNPRKRQKREPPYSGLTVKEFFETLSYRSDFSNDHSALITLCFQRSLPEDSFTSSKPRPARLASTVLRMLKSLTFESDSESIRSSNKLLTMIKMLGVSSFPIAHSDDQNQDPLHDIGSKFKEIYHLIQPHSSSLSEDDNRRTHQAPVSDLQGFIKRKIPRPSV